MKTSKEARKVAVLTLYYKSINFGGVLQAYALNRWLTNNGADVTLINYDRIPIRAGGFKNCIKNICVFMRSKIKNAYGIKLNTRKKAFNNFKTAYIKDTSKIYNVNTINNLGESFDVYIVGSDQIWNGISHGINTAYLLDFVPIEKKKIAYAASMTKFTLTNEQIKLYSDLLERFNAISVREDEAREYLSSFFEKKDILLTADPTQLLSRSEWDDIASERMYKDRYVFIYLLGADSRQKQVAREFAQEMGLKTIYVVHAAGRYNREDSKKEFDYCVSGIGPCEFVSLIKYADYIITDSFHAASFATIYAKELFVLARNNAPQMGSRIRTLLTDVGAEDRFITGSTNAEELLQMGNITYDFSKMDEKVKYSQAFLYENLDLN